MNGVALLVRDNIIIFLLVAWVLLVKSTLNVKMTHIGLMYTKIHTIYLINIFNLVLFICSLKYKKTESNIYYSTSTRTKCTHCSYEVIMICNIQIK